MQVFKEIEVADLASMLEDTDHGVSLIDIRSPTDANRESIPGARNVPLHQLPQELERLHNYRITAKILCFKSSCHISVGLIANIQSTSLTQTNSEDLKERREWLTSIKNWTHQA